MRVDTDVIMDSFKAVIFTKILPSLSTNYVAGSAAVIGMACHLLAQQADQSADLFYTDNQAIQQLFSGSLSLVTNSELKQSLRNAIKEQSPSIKISDLAALNDRLNRLLIKLHTFVESQNTDAAEQMERAILQHLHTSSDRRLLDILPMS